MQKVFAQIKKAEKKAELIEIWIDEIKDFDLEELMKSTKTPLLLKAIKDIDVLEKALGKVAFIDVDINTHPRKIKNLKHKKTKLIISFHDYKKTPSTQKLKEIVEKAINLGADIVKVATFANSIEDNVKVLSLLTKYPNKKIIAICMGEQGKLSRIMGLILGSEIVYAALDNKSKTAEGQMTVKEFSLIK